jgi:DNA polymerase/3'-5' exonuclease PolX
VGPKCVHLLHERLGIDTVDKLAAAAKKGKLRTAPDIGPGIEAKVLRAITEGAGTVPRTKLATAVQIVVPLLRHFRQADGVQRAEVAGSYRRRRDSVGNLDIVVAAEPSRPVCYLELNAQPDRLDLTDAHCRLAKQLRLKVAVSTDAHATVELDFIRFGVDQARRGWLEPEDVLNTRPLSELRTILRRRR